MTVAELIRELGNYDGDLEVVVYSHHYAVEGYLPVDDLRDNDDNGPQVELVARVN